MSALFRRKFLLWFCAVVSIPLVAIGQESQETQETQETAEAPRLLTTYQDMLDALTRGSVPHQADEEKKSVRIQAKAGDSDVVMLINWQELEGIVQFIQPLPIEITEDRVPAMETAIVRLNHKVSVPGFGLDHDNRRPYYRFIVPIKTRGGLYDAELQFYFQMTVRQALAFLPPLKQVAEGAEPIGTIDAMRRPAEKPSP